MKKLIGSDLGKYGFSPLTKEIYLYEIPTISQANILLVTNVTRGVVLYSFTGDNTGIYTNGVLTVVFDTTTMDSADVLQILVDIPEDSPYGSFDSCQLDDQYAEVPPPQVVSLAGIEVPGRRPEQMSFPVTLPDEQIFDANLSAVFPVASLGANALSPTGNWVDCARYRSLSFEIVAPTGVTVTLTFEGSNDGSFAVAVPLFDSAATSTAPVTSVAVAAATNRFFEGPIKYRYFRARISTAVAGGIISTFTRLSMAPWVGAYTQVANSAGNWSSNVAQIGGTNVVTGGVNGTLAIGGNIAAGTAPTVNPITIGGIDTLGKVRRISTDFYGNQPVVGVDPNLSLNTNPIRVRQEDGNSSGYGVQDLLYLILQELKTLRYLPEMLNTGRASDIDIDAITSDVKQQ